MRKLAHFTDRSKARALSDFLLAKGIANQVDPEDAQWAVWVHDDDHLEPARGHLELFQSNPGDPSIRSAVQKANAIREEQRREAKNVRSKPVDMRTHWHLQRERIHPVTYTLILLAVAVWVVDNFVPGGSRFMHWLFISEYRPAVFLPEVRAGQVWRLITPIFMHASIKAGLIGILHIFFNMSWMTLLGPMIERNRGSLFLLAQVLIIAVISNMAQYLNSGPYFLGMSGIVCGLFGYAWIVGRYNSGMGMGIDRNTVVYFVGFLFLGLTGFLGPIGNAAHFGGLIAGMIWGYVDSGRFRWKMKRLMGR